MIYVIFICALLLLMVASYHKNPSPVVTPGEIEDFYKTYPEIIDTTEGEDELK
jgi:hypothetical protein